VTSPPISTGVSLGEYQLLDELGSGGMGVAYKAFDTRLKRTVAVKTLHAALSDAPVIKRRLLREARAAAALAHPNICTVHAIDEADGLPFIVMEYVKGRTLADVIADGPMDPREVTAVGVQVVDALAAAHARGIVHRDIKPANIMVTDDGQVKVLDFGLAGPAVAGTDIPPAMSASTVGHSIGGIQGTVGYMSPEQLEGLPIDGRTDIFSLGVVLYELSTGRNPFIRPNPFVTVARVLSVSAPPVRDSLPEFPAHLDWVIQRCLAKSLDDRYANVGELQADLAQESTKSLWRQRDVRSLPSVAVLPFASLSNDPDDAYLADALSSELTSRLAAAGDLLVISRTSTMRYREMHHDAREAGRELGVRALIEGSLRVRDGACRVTANLIDVESGFHLWAGTFETPIDGLDETEATIVRHVTTALSVRRRSPGPPAVGLRTGRAALEPYLRALHAYHKFSSADNLTAIELLHRAIEHDHSNARAHALLASACLARIERGWESDVPRWLGLAQQACSEALRLDPRNSEAHAARGLMSFFAKRNAEAEANVREALRGDSNNDIAHDLLGRIRFARGEFLGAIAAYRDALTVNPHYVWCLNDLAWALMLTGEEAEAEATLERVLSLSPGDEGGHCGRAAFLHVRGQSGDALREIRKAEESNPHYPWVLQLLPPILASNGQHEEAVARCEAMAAHPEGAYFGYGGLGLVSIEIGDRDRLEDSVRQAMQTEPFYSATNLSYASLYDAAGEPAIAAEWVRKAVREGVRLVEVNDWHPTLKRLASHAGLIPARSDHG
jgi:serine/threonine protein kinase/tetratricopeptide (TPR) repeat protein